MSLFFGIPLTFSGTTSVLTKGVTTNICLSGLPIFFSKLPQISFTPVYFLLSSVCSVQYHVETELRNARLHVRVPKVQAETAATLDQLQPAPARPWPVMVGIDQSCAIH